MFISLPRDESTILLMDLHLTKILAVGKPNFIEVNRIINIAFQCTWSVSWWLDRAGQGWGRDGVLLKLKVMSESDSVRGAEEKNTFFVVSSPTPPAHLVYLTRGGEMSSNVSLHYQYCKLEVPNRSANRHV